MSPPTALIYARGRFVRTDGGIFFYDSDGRYIDSIADLFSRVWVAGLLVEPGDPGWEGASRYRHRFRSPNVREVHIRGWRSPTGFCASLSRVAPLAARADVLVSMGPTWMSYGLALMVPRRAAVVLYNGFDWRPDRTVPAVARAFERHALSKADFVLCTGAHLRKLYEERYGHRGVRETAPLLTLPYDLAAREPARDRSAPLPEPRILSVGHLLPRKRQGDLLRAAAMLRRGGGRPLRVDIAGLGEMGRFRQEHAGLVEEMGTSLVFHGHVAAAGKLVDLYERADVLVVTSEAEGVPRVVYEAMMLGVPVISTPLPGLTDLLRDGEEVLFYPCGDCDALGVRLARLLDDGALRAKLSANGRRLAARVLATTPREQMLGILGRMGLHA
jgi:glycosyltransferase involved in cell wall biosynthesis